MMAEEWRPVVVAPDYSVSSRGRVRDPGGRLLARTMVGRRGFCYPAVRVERRTRVVHRLVAFAFLGEPPPGRPQVNHKNGDKQDARLANLEWCSSLENTQHAWRELGFNSRGRGNRRSGLAVSEAVAIKAAYWSGESMAAICGRFGVTRSTACSIGRGLTWPHLHTVATDPLYRAPTCVRPLTSVMPWHRGFGPARTPSDPGRRLREQREARGLGLCELARVSGCSRSYLSDMELGKRPVSGRKAMAVLDYLRRAS